MLVCYMQYGVLKQANQTHYYEYDIRIRRGKLYGYDGQIGKDTKANATCI